MLSSRLQELVSESGKSQKEIGISLSLSQQRINHYISGKRQPDADTIVALAKFFNVSTDYLLGASDIRNPYSQEASMLMLPRVERDALVAVRRYKSDPYFPELISLYGEASERDRALVRQILSEYSEKNSPALPVDAGESVG